MEFLNTYIIINIFIIGCLFGSFLSLATYRIPRKKDIVFTRSFCTNCKHNLGFFDLIPVLSYLINGGKCRYCKNPISVRYYIYEMLSGTFFVLTYVIFGFSIYTLIVYALYVTLAIVIGSKISIRNEKNIQKKGFLFIEIIVAFVIFGVIATTVYINSNNYIKKYITEQVYQEAYVLALINSEISLGTKYDDLVSSTDIKVIDNTTYTINVNVSKYADNFLDKEDVIKQINVEVNYIHYNTEYSVEINSIKKRV